jgi:hypothetical protein
MTKVLMPTKDRRDELLRACSCEFYSGGYSTRAKEIARDAAYPAIPRDRGFNNERRKQWRVMLADIHRACGGKVPGARQIENILKGKRTPSN